MRAVAEKKRDHGVLHGSQQPPETCVGPIEESQHKGSMDRGEQAVVHHKERNVGQLGPQVGEPCASRTRHFQDIVEADDQVLRPVQEYNGGRVPAQEQDAPQRDRIDHNQA